MDDDSDYSTSKLENCSYRYLQQLAKSMQLPSNVKKVYLVEMINAKKCSPETEVLKIVQRVKLERQHLTQVRKRSRRTLIPRIKFQPDTSSDESSSPPITLTPKRPQSMLRCSDLRHQIIKPQNTIVRTSTSKSVATVVSDRVLRSCNVKTIKRPYVHKYSEINHRHQADHRNKVDHRNQVDYRNHVDHRNQKSFKSQANHRNQVGHRNQMDHLNQVDLRNQVDVVDQGTQMSVMRVVKKYKPNILGSQNKDRQPVPVTQMGSSQVGVARARRPSGVSPLSPLVAARGLGLRVRARDGSVAALTAFVRRPDDNGTGLKRNIELTVQDIINGNVDAQAMSLNYPNTSGVPDTPEYTEVTPETTSSVYYHKKIRAEQVRERRMSSANNRWYEPRLYPERCELPRIGEVFHQFRSQQEPRDVTQPIYVQVSEECERILHYPQYTKNTCLLETVYNFRNDFLTGQTLLQPAADTKCVFSTPVVATAAPHRPGATSAEYMPPYEGDYYGAADSSRDCLRFAGPEFDFQCHEEQKTSGSLMGTAQSPELGANVTISDMVEDALELISQDGDYMERMGMDVRMQCVLCNWAGPQIILEYHIRKEHANEIDHQEKREWNITYTLGSISQQLWNYRVICHATALYVLSVKHEPPGRLLATLTSISPDPELATGSITVFNKVSGEPFTWCGDIHELPATPYDNHPGLQVDLASLDLLPNSANLKFINGELVLQSPTKVVFGSLELNDIHIILFVKISD